MPTGCLSEELYWFNKDKRWPPCASSGWWISFGAHVSRCRRVAALKAAQWGIAFFFFNLLFIFLMDFHPSALSENSYRDRKSPLPVRLLTFSKTYSAVLGWLQTINWYKFYNLCRNLSVVEKQGNKKKALYVFLTVLHFGIIRQEVGVVCLLLGPDLSWQCFNCSARWSFHTTWFVCLSR